ncbi:uncharacterized protein VTP21DRAFT_390 [Calcarisporiella thermophila]|uniref:uncharacterized protein n=1 Tax=Calcarisporiella thermophila TaxID=911321 RepID=UPI0037439781
MSLGRAFKLNTGSLMPAVGLGTWLSKPNEVQHAVEVALEAGYRHIDCAHVYGNENEVGLALKNQASKVPRDKIFITSKLWNSYHRPEHVVEGLNKTLKDLGTDYLDLYLMHWPVAFKPGDSLFPTDESKQSVLLDDIDFTETWAAMEKLVETGKVRSIGVSNFNIPRLEKLLKTAKIVPAVNQVELHPYLPQEELVAYCNQKGIHVSAYSPLGNNLRGMKKVIDEEVVVEVAKKNNKTPAQVLISWAVQRGTSVLPKSVTPDRIRSNFEDFVLSDEDFAALNALSKGKNIRYCIPCTFNPRWPVNDVFGDDLEQAKKMDN